MAKSVSPGPKLFPLRVIDGFEDFVDGLVVELEGVNHKIRTGPYGVVRAPSKRDIQIRGAFVNVPQPHLYVTLHSPARHRSQSLKQDVRIYIDPAHFSRVTDYIRAYLEPPV